jgi:hypothetical protein
MNKISNPFLKQIISEISNKATEGRVDSSISWGVLTEAKKKKKKVSEGNIKKQDEEPSEEPAQEETPKEEPQGQEDVGGNLPDQNAEKGGEDKGGLPDLGAEAPA